MVQALQGFADILQSASFAEELGQGNKKAELKGRVIAVGKKARTTHPREWNDQCMHEFRGVLLALAT